MNDNAGHAIRWSTVAAVAAVAGIAGWVSYEHAYEVVIAHGETGMVARVYPGTVDGLIYAASMVLLDATRRGVKPHPLARWLLGAGISATLAANIAAGVSFGPVGAAVASWPALALVGSYELLMLIIRGQHGPATKTSSENASHTLLETKANTVSTAVISFTDTVSPSVSGHDARSDDPLPVVRTRASGRWRKGKSRRGGSVEHRREQRAAMSAEAMTVLDAEPGIGRPR